MNKITKYTVIGVVALALILGVAKMFSGGQTPGASSTGFDNGLTVGGGTYAATPALAVTGAVTVSGTITSGGVNSTTTTSTAETMSAADLVGFSVISVTPQTGALTITLPATSTLTTWLPNSGDTATFILFNASTTANQTVTLAAGTGTLLEVGSTTASAITAPAKASRVTVFRKWNTDLVFLTQNFF